MPPTSFVIELCNDAGADKVRLGRLHLAAQEAQPRGWGHATRLRQEAATARRQAMHAKRELQLTAAALADAQDRICELEQQLANLRGLTSPAGHIGGRPVWYAGPRGRLLTRQTPAFGAQVDQVSDRIVAHLRHPQSGPGIPACGTVLVPQQSGKSAYVSAVTVKAADAGFGLVMVLSGPWNAERTQLQANIEAALPPRAHDIPPVRWLTSVTRDYRRAVRQLRTMPDRQPILMVVKRNAAVLRKVIADLREARNAISDVPALIIDAAGDTALAGDRVESLLNSVLDVVPRTQYIRFASVGADQGVPSQDFVLSVPASDD
ncbi:hypothetical protein GCM10010170_100000 [Dactylosporangium salmoneum]|uniref:Uncharacterized protein n=2 Tax=Dactylosporangium salmoneum TaxID=53361 RepID=A0ABP5UZP5_9ACTN